MPALIGSEKKAPVRVVCGQGLSICASNWILCGLAPFDEVVDDARVGER